MAQDDESGSQQSISSSRKFIFSLSFRLFALSLQEK
jgi:hypothetical protein